MRAIDKVTVLIIGVSHWRKLKVRAVLECSPFQGAVLMHRVDYLQNLIFCINFCIEVSVRKYQQLLVPLTSAGVRSFLCAQRDVNTSVDGSVTAKVNRSHNPVDHGCSALSLHHVLH